MVLRGVCGGFGPLRRCNLARLFDHLCWPNARLLQGQEVLVRTSNAELGPLGDLVVPSHHRPVLSWSNHIVGRSYRRSVLSCSDDIAARSCRPIRRGSGGIMRARSEGTRSDAHIPRCWDGGSIRKIHRAAWNGLVFRWARVGCVWTCVLTQTDGKRRQIWVHKAFQLYAGDLQAAATSKDMIRYGLRFAGRGVIVGLSRLDVDISQATVRRDSRNACAIPCSSSS